MPRPILAPLQLEGELFSLDIPSHRTTGWLHFFGWRATSSADVASPQSTRCGPRNACSVSGNVILARTWSTKQMYASTCPHTCPTTKDEFLVSLNARSQDWII